eukprot:scpid94241/ scgid33815/ 
MSSNPVVIEQTTDPELCPVATLRQYINKTATAWETVVNQPVFITLRQPYRGLSSASIAQLLSQMLKHSGQQQGISARSLGPTGARKAIASSVELSLVQRRGRWKTQMYSSEWRHYAGITSPATDAILS